MQYIEVKSSDIPLDLLLEADPSEASIVKAQTNSLAEIFNVSVYPELQGQGIGSKLLKLVLLSCQARGSIVSSLVRVHLAINLLIISV